MVAAGCGSSDAAVTTITTETIVSTETVQLCPVRVDGKWGFIDNTGTTKIERQFAGIRRLDGEGGLIGFCEALCAVQLAENGLWGYIDKNGTRVPEVEGPGGLRLSISSGFSEGLAVAYTIEGVEGVAAGLAGYVDVYGSLVIEPQFNVAGEFSDGLAPVGIGENDEAMKCGYIDKTGAVVIPIQYQIAGFDFSGGVARVGGG